MRLPPSFSLQHPDLREIAEVVRRARTLGRVHGNSLKGMIWRPDGALGSTPTPTPTPIRSRAERVQVRERNGRLAVAPSVVAAISATIGSLPAETGGFLGITDGCVDKYRFDETSATTRATYEPDIRAANEERLAIERDGGRFCGLVHSHPGWMSRPSQPDRTYAQLILRNAKVDELVLPIVLPRGGGDACSINWYVARPGNRELAEIVPVEVDLKRNPLPAQFDRVQGAYDSAWLRRCRIVAVGCGGAREAIENLARIGVGQFVLVDPDLVSAENLATQAVQRREIGRPKVIACAEAIARINPDAAVVTVQRRIQNTSRGQLDMLLTGRWLATDAPVRTLVGLWSDSPAANAFGHRMALNAGLPAVSASLHVGGASGEIVLVYPGRTPGCIRCATNGRYEHYLAGGSNDATSAGAPLWTTPRLNALKVCVTAAALHAIDPHERGKTSPERAAQTVLLEQIVRHPMALLRLSPDAADVSGLRVHEYVLAGCQRPDRILFDETVWREVEPLPDCPDCGGHGDLRRVIGRHRHLDALPEARMSA